MEKILFQAEKIDRGIRIDHYLVKNLKFPMLRQAQHGSRHGEQSRTISRCQAQRLINSGSICVNQHTVKAHYKIKEHDLISGVIPDPVRPQAQPEKIPLEIVFEEDALLVVNKPDGLVTHPAVGNYSHTLVNALLNHTSQLSAVGGPLRPGIVHRLDKDTSGLMVVAKTDFAHQHLARQFQRHTVKRKYIALVAGRVEHNQGIIDYPLARDPRNRQKIAVTFLPQSKKALTKYQVIKRFARASLLELTAHTGRTHQLRVHLKFLGHPILGDKRYGTAGSFRRLALHATELGFRHPCTEQLLEFRSDIPECFQEFIDSSAH